MDNSFFEYRDKTGADSGSDNEIIDDSMVLESVPYSAKKKNRTVFVAETDESISNDDAEEYIASSNLSKSTARRSSAAAPHVILSSDDDGSRRDSFRKPSESTNNVVVSSSDEEEDYSPELIPKRRPPPQQKANNSNQSLVLQRTKKRMLFQDSDTDNSIIIERNKGNKQKCLKDTPLKIESKQKVTGMDLSLDNDSCDGDDDENDVDSEEEDDSVKDDESDSEKENDEDSGNDDAHDPHPISAIKKKCKKLVINSDESSDENDDTSLNTSNKPNLSLKIDDENNDENSKTTITKVSKRLVIEDDSDEEIISEALNKSNISNGSHGNDHDIHSNNNSQESVEIDDDADEVEDDDDGPDEDMMVMSRATRMSIMGMIPKDNDSDDSDFIQSDSSTTKSDENQPLPEIKLKNKTSEKSDDDLPEVITNNIQLVNTNIEDLHEISVHSDESRISCSPFSSPLKDITNKSINIEPKHKSKALNSDKISDFMDLTVMPEIRPSLKTTGVIDLSNVESNVETKAEIKMLDKSASILTKHVASNDDDVTIIDTKPEVIDLSSDDEDEVKPEKKSQGGKSPQQNVHDIPYSESIKQYFAPSRPGEVVYVKKHVKENELNKLNRLKEDLASVRMLLDEMDLSTLPDGGSRLEARHRALEDEVRRQGTRVANMVLEPDNPSSAEMAADGLDAGLSWEDIQKASNAVQPRMFGKQAMATHMAERNLIVDRLRELHASLASRPPERSHAPAPRLLLSTLMPHQRHALAWLRWRETQRPPAGILADDMGLGKTITMISLIASDKEGKIEEDDPPEGTAKERLVRGGTLVVCPASLLQQWAGEVSKHCSARALSVCLHHGAARATQPHRLATHDVVATTYNILQRDSDKNGVLMRVQWRRVILDEAHIVRNHKSATSVAVCGLKGRRRWCLTGTPVQNKDLDLFALLKFLRLSPFDDLQMWKKWIDNKSQGGQERLNIVMQCILLRRTKVGLQEAGQLACLPPRTAHTRLVTLASDEMNVYQKVLVLSKTLFAQFLHQRAEKNSAVTSFAAPANGSEYEKMHKKMIALQGVKPVKSHEILVLLLRLRQVCCHCGLVGSMLDAADPGAQPEPAAADLLRELDKLSLDDDRDKRKSRNHEEAEEVGVEETAKADEAIRAVLGSSAPVFQLSRPSSKITAVMECLESVFSNKGDKAVVVSQWTSVLSLVEKELNKKKIRSVTLSGAVPVTARPRLIDLVNDEKSDVRVMLLSLCAGGVGINLCGANHLLLLDPHWNPQLEEQAQDRIYRVGQNKPVHIYRFVCVDTVEQTIRKLQEAKLQLAENVLTGAGNKAGSPLSVEELKMLFNMGS